MRLIVCIILLFSSTAMADMKVAVFDMEFAIQQTPDGKAAKKKLIKEFKLIEGKLKKREVGIREKVSAFEKKAMILSDKKKR